MNIAGTCSAASESEASQTLAIVLSIVFAFYIGSALLLSSLQLYTISAESTSRGDRGQQGIGAGGIPLVDMSVGPMKT
jgi:hypothetical protein